MKGKRKKEGRDKQKYKDSQSLVSDVGRGRGKRLSILIIPGLRETPWELLYQVHLESFMFEAH